MSLLETSFGILFKRQYLTNKKKNNKKQIKKKKKKKIKIEYK